MAVRLVRAARVLALLPRARLRAARLMGWTAEELVVLLVVALIAALVVALGMGGWL